MNFQYLIKTLFTPRIFNNKMIFGFIGLALGLTAFMLIIQYAYYEYSYDDFHEKKARVYRVTQKTYTGGNFNSSIATCGRLIGETLIHDYPEIEDVARIHIAPGNPRVKYKDKTFFEKDKCFYTEPSFFNVFTFPLIKGNKQDLEKPDVVFITESAAFKYFGKEDPLGKQIEFFDHFGNFSYFVGGIIKDIPNNTHVHFDFLFSNTNILKHVWYNNNNLGWTWSNFYTYILLNPKNDNSSLQKKLPAFVNNHMNTFLAKENKSVEFFLQPLLDIHLHSNLQEEIEANGDYTKVFFLIVISLMVFLISLSNFINLYSLSILDRAKEFTVKHVIGAPQKVFIKQFTVDSIIIHSILLIVTILLVLLTNSAFNEIIGVSYENPFWKYLVFWIVLGGILITGTIFLCFYPLLLISKLDIVTILKGKGANPKSSLLMREVMVVFQLTLSLILIIVSFSMNRQISYMQNEDIGINIKQKIVSTVPSTREYGERAISTIESLINELKNNKNISNVSCSADLPGRPYSNEGFIRKESDSENQNKILKYIWGNNGYIKNFNIKLLAGENFPEIPRYDYSRLLLTKSAVKLLGYEDLEAAVQQEIYWLGGKAKILGVIDDYNHLSLKESISPIALIENTPFGPSYLCIEIKENKIKETLAFFKKKYNEYLPDIPFDYFFLDDTYNNQYSSEIRFEKMSVSFTILILVISIISLISLISYLLIKKTKEIAVRSILGATALSLYFISIKSIIQSVLIAAVISASVTYLWLDKWLNNFAYAMKINIWLFLFPIIVLVFITLLTTIFHILKVIFNNPAHVLKEE